MRLLRSGHPHFVSKTKDTTQKHLRIIATRAYLTRSNQLLCKNMEVINRDDVPTYLRSGSFFLNLDSSDTGTFEVPSECFKRDPTVTNTDELTFVLQTARFWGLCDPPATVVSFGVRNSGSFHVGSMIKEFPEYSTFHLQVFHIRQLPTDELILSAIDVGLGVAVVEHLHEQEGFPLSSECFLAAVKHDNVATIHYLESRGCVWHEGTVSAMVRNGSLQCLKYALENEHPLPEDVTTTAAQYRQKEILQYLLNKNVKPTSHTMEILLHQGDIQLVKLLHRAGIVWSADTACICVMHDHIDCLIYATENGHILETELCIFSARSGSLRCLEYVHLHGCPWDANATFMAARYGHFECLKYAHQRGCPISATSAKFALNHGAWRCALYCILNGALLPQLAYCVFMWVLTLLQLVAFCFLTPATHCVCCNTFLLALLYSAKVFDIWLGETYNRYVQSAILMLLFASMGVMMYMYNLSDE